APPAELHRPIPALAPARDSGPRFLLSLLAMALPVAAPAIARNQLRSALTMLGIFIGVAALITMVAVGEGANAAVIKQIESLGANLLVILPGANTTSGVRGGFGSASTLRVADAEAIRREAPAGANVGWMIRGMAQTQYREKNWNTTVQGVSPSFLEIQSWPLSAGRKFDAPELESAARVCVIGQTVMRNLFGAHENPLGAEIQVRNV